MVMKASEKIIDALTQLMEGYSELQDGIESDYALDESEDDLGGDSSVSAEIDAAIITEMRSALEAVIDAEDLSPEEVASAVSSLTEALEEIDPDVFEVDEEASEEEDEIYGASAEEDSDDGDYYDDDDDELDDEDDEDDELDDDLDEVDDYDDDDDEEEGEKDDEEEGEKD